MLSGLSGLRKRSLNHKTIRKDEKYEERIVYDHTAYNARFVVLLRIRG